MVRAHVLNYVGRYILLRDGYAAAVGVLQNELNSADTQPPEYTVRLLYSLVVLQFLAGRVDDMDLAVQRYAKLAFQTNLAAQIQTSRLARGLVWYERNKRGEALQQLAAIFEQPDLALFQTLRLASVPLIELYAADGRHDEGRAVVGALQARLNTSPDSDELDEVEAIAAYWSMLSGSFAPAEALMQGGVGKVWYDEAPYRDGIYVRLLHARGQPGDLQQAMGIIEQSLAAYGTMCDVRGQIGMWVLAAQTRWRLGQQVQALQALRRALDMGYGCGWRRTFTEPGALMGEMLHKVAREEAYAAVAGSLLAELARATDGGLQHPTQRPDAQRSSGATSEQFIELLSDREIEVLGLIANKLTNKEIARRLCISPLTVRNHTVRIYDKLQVGNRRRAVQRAQQLGMIPML
jgi:LuxR family maltose regulon positive regulatory protein